MTNYYYILMSQLDIFQSQVLEEILREKSNYLISKSKTQDFWIINNPKIDEICAQRKNSQFYKQKNKEILDESKTEYYSLLISTSKEFINWLKLRIGYFENLKEMDEITKANFVSDGLTGILNKEDLKNIFQSNNKKIKPSILANRLKKSMEIYYKN